MADCERVESVSNVVTVMSQHVTDRRRGRGSLLISKLRIYNVHGPLQLLPHFPCGLVGISGFRPLRCCIKGQGKFCLSAFMFTRFDPRNPRQSSAPKGKDVG